MGPVDRPRPIARPVSVPARVDVQAKTGSGTSPRANGLRTPAAVRAEAASLAVPAGAIRRHGPDAVIVLVVLALTALGLLVVYSSSAMDGYLSKERDTFATLGPQLQWAAVGLLGMLLAMRLDYRWLRLASVPLLLAAALLLLLIQVARLPADGGRVVAVAQAPRPPGDPARRAREAGPRDLPGPLDGPPGDRGRRVAQRAPAVRGDRGALRPAHLQVAGHRVRRRARRSRPSPCSSWPVPTCSISPGSERRPWPRPRS